MAEGGGGEKPSESDVAVAFGDNRIAVYPVPFANFHSSLAPNDPTAQLNSLLSRIRNGPQIKLE